MGEPGTTRAPSTDGRAEHCPKRPVETQLRGGMQPELHSPSRLAQGCMHCGKHLPFLVGTKALSAAETAHRPGCNLPEEHPFLIDTKME